MMILTIFLLLFLAYILSTMGRRGHPVLDELRTWHYAHRGLHDETVPENSMEAFSTALVHGYGAELDVHLLRDGSLAVIHDSDLRRVTGREGRVEDLTAAELSNYKLGGTENTIPSFQSVLSLFNGKAPLIIELKVANNNYAALCETVCKALEDYNGPYCLESFDPRCIRWLRKNRPELIRGQLTENYFRSATGKKLPWVLRLGLTYQMLNFLTMPDFVAYRHEDRKNLSCFLTQKLWGLSMVGWTVGDVKTHEEITSDGWISIFEGFTPK